MDRRSFAQTREPLVLNDEEISTTIEKLFADLEIDQKSQNVATNLKSEFSAVLRLSNDPFATVALDVAVFVAFAGDWVLSLEILDRLVACNDDRIEIKLWQLKCYVELSRFAEAISLSGAIRWPQSVMIHVNFLTGVALEALNLKEQASSRFRAVYDTNAQYQDVAKRLLNR